MAKKIAKPYSHNPAATKAKRAKIKEAGLGGRRVGKASATGRRAQARRDSKR